MNTTTTNNTFIAMSQAKSSLRMAETALNNTKRMNTSQFGEAYVQKRTVDCSAAVARWTAEISRMEAEGVTNETPIAEQSTEQSEKAKRKALKKADKRVNMFRGTAPSVPRRKFTGKYMTQAEKRERELLQKLERFESFELKGHLLKKLESMPCNQGMHIGGIMHLGKAPARGNPNRFSYTKREKQPNGETKVFEYVSVPIDDGYKRITKFHNGVEVHSESHRSPFSRGLPRTREYTATEKDFPVLARATVIPRAPVTAPTSAWTAAPTTPRNQSTTPVPPNAPSRPTNTSEWTVSTAKRAPKKSKITLTPAMESRIAALPQNVGMFVSNKIFWGKKPKSPHPTMMATKLTTIDGKRGVLRYTWNSRCYREAFKPQHSRDWQQLCNERMDGRRRMSIYS